MTDFALAPNIDAAALVAPFRQFGRLQIGGFLTAECARALFDELAASAAWKLTANRGEQVLDFAAETLAGFTPEQHAKMDEAVTLGGRYGFQFRYDTIRTAKTDAGLADDRTLLAGLIRFLSSPEMVAFFRTLTGADDVAFVDGHASRYQPGHFLSAHDDHVEGQGRRAAYVLNLTPQWLPDWGGLLQFYDQHRNVTRGYTPGFNMLNIFAVPQPHSVSWVTPLAAHPRYAVTGWLRAGARDG